MFTPDTLAGQVVLITGGGTGLGLAMAKHFVAHGARVALCGRRPEPLQRAEAELGPAARGWVCDVRDYDAVGRMLEDVVKSLGPLTGLVNNAAGNFLSASEDLSPNGFRVVVDIVLHGTFNCTQQAGRYWLANSLPGAVVNIVTTYTETGNAFVLPSACAKAGVYALTNSLAYEWGPYGIRLNSVAPGPFPTEGAWSRLVPGTDFGELMATRNPLGRVGQPEELADLVLFLLSPHASYINGACYAIDGGERLQGAQFNALTHWRSRGELRQVFAAMKAARGK